jgi:hypothetical protein
VGKHEYLIKYDNVLYSMAEPLATADSLLQDAVMLTATEY